MLGCSGCEHAIVEKLSQSSRIFKIFVSPGNAGTQLCSEKVTNIELKDNQAIAAFCVQNDVTMVCVGQLKLLASGISYLLNQHVSIKYMLTQIINSGYLLFRSICCGGGN